MPPKFEEQIHSLLMGPGLGLGVLTPRLVRAVNAVEQLEPDDVLSQEIIVDLVAALKTDTHNLESSNLSDILDEAYQAHLLATKADLQHLTQRMIDFVQTNRRSFSFTFLHLLHRGMRILGRYGLLNPETLALLLEAKGPEGADVLHRSMRILGRHGLLNPETVESLLEAEDPTGADALHRSMHILGRHGLVNSETLELLLESENPEDAAVLWSVASQHNLPLTAEHREVFKTRAATRSAEEETFRKLISLMGAEGLLHTSEQLLDLSKMNAHEFAVLFRAMMYCPRLFDEVVLKQILSPEYAWVFTVLADFSFLGAISQMHAMMPDSAFFTSERLSELFGKVGREIAAASTDEKDEAVSYAAEEISESLRLVASLTQRLTELAPGGHLAAEGLGILAQINLNTLLELWGIFGHRDVGEVVEQTPLEVFTQALWNELLGLAREGVAAVAEGRNTIDQVVEGVIERIDRDREALEPPPPRQQLVLGHGNRQDIHSPVFEQSVGEAMKNLWRVWGGRFRERTEEKGKDYYWDEITAAVKAGQDRAISEQEEQERKDWEKCSQAVEYLRSSGAANSRWDVTARVSVSLAQLVGMAWSIIHDGQQRVAGVELDQAKKRFLMTAFRDSAEAYSGTNPMSCAGGFRNRVIQGLDGVISKDIVDLVLQTPTMAANRFPVLVREAVLGYFEQRPEPQTAEDYRTCKAALDELLAGSEIPRWVCQEIKASVREGMATQFSRLYEGPEGLAHLDELVGLMASVSMGPTKDEIRARLTAIQTRLESSQGAHLDREEQATPPTPTLKL